MIPDSLFQPQLKEIGRLLKRLSLLAEHQQSPSSTVGAAECKGKTYREQYEMIVREFAYDFRLSDQALLRFCRGGCNVHSGSLSYSYYESPVAVMSYEDFVAVTANATAGTREYKVALEQAGSELMPDYEEYVINADVKTEVTPIRYDYMARDYRCGIHPASHIHVGCNNDIRFGTRRVMTPMAFCLFVIRQRYPAAWTAFQKWNTCSELCRHVREKLTEVNRRYWSKMDEQEAYFC